MFSSYLMRASDQDRQAVVAALCDAYATGRLDLAEVEDRAVAAYLSRTGDELGELTADLPVGAGAGWPAVPTVRVWSVADLDHGPSRQLASALLIALAWLAMTAAAWVPAAALPLIVLSLSALFAAVGAADRPADPPARHARLGLARPGTCYLPHRPGACYPPQRPVAPQLRPALPELPAPRGRLIARDFKS